MRESYGSVFHHVVVACLRNYHDMTLPQRLKDCHNFVPNEEATDVGLHSGIVQLTGNCGLK